MSFYEEDLFGEGTACAAADVSAEVGNLPHDFRKRSPSRCGDDEKAEEPPRQKKRIPDATGGREDPAASATGPSAVGADCTEVDEPIGGGCDAEQVAGDEGQSDGEAEGGAADQPPPLPCAMHPEVEALLLRIAAGETEREQAQAAAGAAAAAAAAKISALEALVVSMQQEVAGKPAAAAKDFQEGISLTGPSLATAEHRLLTMQLEHTERERIAADSQLHALETYSRHVDYLSRRQLAAVGRAATVDAVAGVSAGEGEESTLGSSTSAHMPLLLGARAAGVQDAVRKLVAEVSPIGDKKAVSVDSAAWTKIVTAVAAECRGFADQHDALATQHYELERTYRTTRELAVRNGLAAAEARLAVMYGAVESSSAAAAAHVLSDKQLLDSHGRLERRVVLLESIAATLLAKTGGHLAPQRVVPQVLKELRHRCGELESRVSATQLEVLLLRRLLGGSNQIHAGSESVVIRLTPPGRHGDSTTSGSYEPSPLVGGARMEELLDACGQWCDRCQQLLKLLNEEKGPAGHHAEAEVLRMQLQHAMAHIGAQNIAIQALRQHLELLATQAAEVGTLRHFVETREFTDGDGLRVVVERLDALEQKLAPLSPKQQQGGKQPHQQRPHAVIAKELASGCAALHAELKSSVAKLDKAYGGVVAAQQSRIGLLSRALERADLLLLGMLRSLAKGPSDAEQQLLLPDDLEALTAQQAATSTSLDLQGPVPSLASTCVYSFPAPSGEPVAELLALQSEAHKEQLAALSASHRVQMDALSQRIAVLSKGKLAERMAQLEHQLSEERDAAHRDGANLRAQLVDAQENARQLQLQAQESSATARDLQAAQERLSGEKSALQDQLQSLREELAAARVAAEQRQEERPSLPVIEQRRARGGGGVDAANSDTSGDDGLAGTPVGGPGSSNSHQAIDIRVEEEEEEEEEEDEEAIEAGDGTGEEGAFGVEEAAAPEGIDNGHGEGPALEPLLQGDEQRVLDSPTEEGEPVDEDNPWGE